MNRTLVSALLLPGCIVLNTVHAVTGAEVNGQDSHRPPATSAVYAGPKLIAIRNGASELELFAANEVRRYVYLRTAKLLPLKKGLAAGDRIAVSCKEAKFCGELGSELAPQEFLLKSVATDGTRTWWIVGGDGTGTLYGAYRFAEKLGIRFGIDEDILPDEPLSGPWPEVNETAKPRFALRGLQPFHDFSVGPDWWNLQDYRGFLSQMAKLRMNFIGFHTYPSWNPAAGPEANVWIGLPADLDKQGKVRSGYEAGVVTTRRGWAVTPHRPMRKAEKAKQEALHSEPLPRTLAARNALFSGKRRFRLGLAGFRIQ